MAHFLIHSVSSPLRTYYYGLLGGVLCFPFINLQAEIPDEDLTASTTTTVVIDMPQELAKRVQKQTGLQPIESLPKTDTATNADKTAEGEEAAIETPTIARPSAAKVVGYRVQIFADNNSRTAKGEARLRERALNASFPIYGTYVTYASPYWRLRVGDFKSQYEAEKAADDIRRAFPKYSKEVRVVRDRVNAR